MMQNLIFFKLNQRLTLMKIQNSQMLSRTLRQ